MAKILTKNQTRHGYHGTSIYKLWAGMVSRCETKSSHNYKYYGGRGISVCKKWRLSPKIFCEWALKNGYAKGLRIDRKDNNKGYTPSNCQFISHKENCQPWKRRIYSSNKTGYSGISQNSKKTGFEVYITINGKQKYIGVRKTIRLALKLKSEIIGNIHDKNTGGK